MTQRLRMLPVGCLLLAACSPSGNSGETDDATTAHSSTDTDPAATGGPATGPGTTGPDTAAPGATGEPDDTTGAATTADPTGPGITTAPDDTTGVTSEPDTDTDSSTDTGLDADTDEPVPDECLLPDESVAPYFTTDVTATVDETCFVSKSVMMGEDVALEFTCPVAGKVAFTLHGGPEPEPYPTEGETFEVFFQQQKIEPRTDPRMGMLLLRNGDKLRYGVATGFLFADEDLARLAAAALPLTLSVESGPCPHVPTFEDEPHGGDEWICNYEALARVRLAYEGAELLQGEGGEGKLMAAGDVYTLDVRLARRGEQCMDDTLDHVALAIAGQNFN